MPQIRRKKDAATALRHPRAAFLSGIPDPVS
jgi:hypothetical protein